MKKGTIPASANFTRAATISNTPKLLAGATVMATTTIKSHSSEVTRISSKSSSTFSNTHMRNNLPKRGLHVVNCDPSDKVAEARIEFASTVQNSVASDMVFGVIDCRNTGNGPYSNLSKPSPLSVTALTEAAMPII